MEAEEMKFDNKLAISKVERLLIDKNVIHFESKNLNGFTFVIAYTTTESRDFKRYHKFVLRSFDVIYQDSNVTGIEFDETIEKLIEQFKVFITRMKNLSDEL